MLIDERPGAENRVGSRYDCLYLSVGQKLQQARGIDAIAEGLDTRQIFGWDLSWEALAERAVARVSGLERVSAIDQDSHAGLVIDDPPV